MQTLSFNVRGMTCSGCTSDAQHALNKLGSANHIRVNLRPGRAIVQSDPHIPFGFTPGCIAAKRLAR